jgi:hypothetical protein
MDTETGGCHPLGSRVLLFFIKIFYSTKTDKKHGHNSLFKHGISRMNLGIYIYIYIYIYVSCKNKSYQPQL